MATFTLTRQDIRTLLIGAYAAFGVYFCMYAFRKPFTVATFENSSFWNIDFKILLIIAQVVGYMISKFLGIKFISELKKEQRFYYLIGLVAAAELSLVAFALLKAPFNLIGMFCNGLTLGMIWGIVFSYLEGRKLTEILGIVLCSSFIVSSGAVKSVGLMVMREMGVTELWMPAVTGGFFFLLFLSFSMLLRLIPAPTEEDIALRQKRIPMQAGERKKVFGFLAVPLTVLVFFYIFLTALRDFRDNFSRELWDGLGFQGNISIYTTAELPIAILVLLSIGFFAVVKNNFRALRYYHYLFVLGALLMGLSTFSFEMGWVDPVVWMVAIGFGLYLCYVPFNCIFFDRVIAVFRIKGNSGFLIYIADSFGYLGSVAVLLYKNFGQARLSWLDFFIRATYAVALVGVIAAMVSLYHFHKKYRRYQSATEPLTIVEA